MQVVPKQTELMLEMQLSSLKLFKNSLLDGTIDKGRLSCLLLFFLALDSISLFSFHSFALLH